MTGLDPNKFTQALIESEFAEARGRHKTWIESELATAKRESDALYKRAEEGGLAVLEETKKKCDVLIENAFREAAVIKAAPRRKKAIFTMGIMLLVVAAYVFGYLAGRTHG